MGSTLSSGAMLGKLRTSVPYFMNSPPRNESVMKICRFRF
jgi:hypothetical protein